MKMFQVSTLQALMLGYSRPVITVSELLKHGDIGSLKSIELKLPDEPVFDTYLLKEASGDEVKQVEQGKS